jgi:hypothetical protein
MGGQKPAILRRRRFAATTLPVHGGLEERRMANYLGIAQVHAIQHLGHVAARFGESAGSWASIGRRWLGTFGWAKRAYRQARHFPTRPPTGQTCSPGLMIKAGQTRPPGRTTKTSQTRPPGRGRPVQPSPTPRSLSRGSTDDQGADVNRSDRGLNVPGLALLSTAKTCHFQEHLSWRPTV